MDSKIRSVLDKLQKVINNYVAKFDLTCRLSTDFGYYWADDVIEYAVVISKRFDALYSEYLWEHYNDVNAPLFLWSLFHEIGHSQTDDFFTDEAHTVFSEYKNSLNPELDSDVMEYYHCPDEALATNWAYLYMRDNASEVEALWNEILPLLQELTTYIDD